MLEQINLTYEKVVLVGIINQLQTEEKSKEYLDELEFLTYTLEVKCSNASPKN